MLDTTNTNTSTTPNTSLRRIGRFTLVALCLLLSYIIFQPLLSLFTSQNQSQQFTTPADQHDERNPFELQLSLSKTSEENIFSLTVDQITADRRSSLDVCLQYLNVYTENKQDPFYIFHVAEGDYQRIIHQIEIACIAKSSIRALGEAYSMETERLPEEKFSEIRFWLPGEEIAVFSPEIEPNIAPIQFAEDTSTFYFPFDRRSSSFAISAPVQISNSQTSTLIIPTSPRLSLKIEAPNWTNQIEKTTEYLGFDPVIKLVFNSQKEETESDQDEMEFIGEEPVTNISIVQHRPLSQRILTAVLLTSLLIFILSLLFIQETGTFLEVAVGILLGLWGVQDILIPSYITGPTLINTLILAFYVLLAFVAAINFAIRPLWHRLGPPSPAPPPDPEPPTPPPTPEPPAPTPVIVQPQKGVLQWVTAVSATITALLTFLHFIRRKD